MVLLCHKMHLMSIRNAQMSIKERLRIVIESQEMSIKAFAELVDTPLRTVHNYLSGEREPSSEFLIKVATQFNINLNWLLLNKDDMYISDGNSSLSIEESELLKQYRAINESGKRILKNTGRIVFDELKAD